MSDFIKYNSKPSGNHKDKKHIVIVGAGIIGVCTAYYLVKHPLYNPKTHHISIVEARRVAGGSSGKAGGLLALWAFPQQISTLSFNLHQELSDEYDGENEWGYRRLTTVSIEGDIKKLLSNEEQDADNEDSISNFSAKSSNSINSVSPSTSVSSEDSETNLHQENTNTNNSSESNFIASCNSSSSVSASSYSGPSCSQPPKKTVKKNSIKHEHYSDSQLHLPPDLNWIRKDIVTDWSSLGGQDTTAQVHPYKFTNFILKKAIELSKGSVELIIGKVNDIIFSPETGEALGINYIPSSVKDASDEIIELRGEQIVLSIGPWTSKLLSDCPISGLRAHSITIAPEKGEVTPFAIFTELEFANNKFVSPEIYARKEEVYVCGEGDTSVDLPETTDDVEVVNEKCDSLFNYVGKISPALQNGRILKRQACYLPVLDVPSSSGPLIGETNVRNLFLASGHSCWGINNAPVTGKVMAELLLEGDATSADISGLDPSLYFDASIYDETSETETDN